MHRNQSLNISVVDGPVALGFGADPWQHRLRCATVEDGVLARVHSGDAKDGHDINRLVQA